MAARNDIAQRKMALLQDLRALHHERGEAVGSTALKQRELSERYGLSIRTISLALQELVEEGVLYTVPRVGTFLGRPAAEVSQPYLMIAHHPREPRGFYENFQIGFEDRIAQLGGASLTLTEEEALWHFEQGNLPALSGVFEMEVKDRGGFGPAGRALLKSGVPGASFGDLPHFDLPLDMVDYNHEEGGVQATRHLLEVGHRNIAFLAMHNEQNEERFYWSKLREEGWRRTMEQVGKSCGNLIFRPLGCVERDADSQRSMAVETAVRFLQSEAASAVIAVNIFAAHGLFQALRELNIPAPQWPAIVCFDNPPRVAGAAGSFISYMRLPWEKIGTEAAQLLWERKTGRLVGPPQRRLVTMQLIPRLTCRSDWALSSRLAQSHIAGTVLRATPALSSAPKTSGI